MRFSRTLAVLAGLSPLVACASSLNGAELSGYWAIPFAGILLSLALCPMVVPNFWHHHYGKVAVCWALACAIPLFCVFGSDVAVPGIAHTLLADYIPFLLFVGALFVIAGGIHIRSTFAGRPVFNTCFLAVGAVLANLMGTTGAAMLLIRPLIHANMGRRHATHTFIFFIFIVANIGGCLTPLGDPPLFLGFLRGVGFFWTATHLFLPWLTTISILLVIYFVIDECCYRREKAEHTFVAHPEKQVPFQIEGSINFLYLAGMVGATLMSGVWRPGIEFTVLDVHLPLQGLVRDACYVALALLSYFTTQEKVHAVNHFNFEPIKEIAKLFFGIFVCIVPVLEMLKAGTNGVFAPLVSLVSTAEGAHHNGMYFWMTGALSAFLDNAPTYLAFFNLAGGDPVILMTTYAKTLMAISMGAVFMGALSYIGNAPNLMTVSIVRQRGIKMPSFFGYMVWSVGILCPTFALVVWFFV